MSCQCVTKIQKMAVGTKVQRGTIIEAAFDHISLYVPMGSNEMSTRTYSEMSIMIQDRKKSVTQPIIHKYCPFCGIEYGKLADLDAA